MPRDRDASSQQLAAFAQVLNENLARLGLTHDGLADGLLARTGRRPTKAAVSQWTRALHEPTRTAVFAMEEVLGLAPGHLSQLLGYLPLGAAPPKTMADVLSTDATITPAQRELLLEMYRLNQRQTAERRARRS